MTKSYIVLSYIGVVIVVAASIVAGILLEALIAGIVVAVFFGIIMLSTISRDRKERTCTKCNITYDFDNDVSYRQIDRKVTNHKVTPSTKGSSIAASETYVVEFQCTCPQCNRTKTFKKNIPGAKITFDGNYAQGSPEMCIEKHFTRHLGFKRGIGELFASLFLSVIACIAVAIIGAVLSGEFSTVTPDYLESNDPKDYYGTYYFVNQNQIVSVDISSSSCQLTFDNIIGEDQTSSCSYEYKSANTHDAVDDKYEDCDAIIIYTSSDKSEGLVLWVVGHENESYKFETNEGIAVTSEQITFDEITNDPKNYYGTYRYNDFYVTINEDGSSAMYLGNDTKTYSFIYMTKELVQASIEGNYSNNAIVLYSNDPSEGYYVFQIQDDNTLILANQYEFTK